MRTNLQKDKHSTGFTLVELLVAIAIIAILSVVGVVIFIKVGQSARDVKKKGDIDAIAKAYEVGYLESGTYRPLQNSDFASGGIPVPLDGGSYSGLINSSSPSFRVCAALEGSSAPACDTPSPTCFCRESQMEKYVAGGGGAGGGSSYEVTQFAGAAAVNACGSPNPNGWENPGNVTSADNSSYTSHQILYMDSNPIYHISRCLDTTNFGFNIPSGATVTGIKVEIMKSNQFVRLNYSPTLGIFTVYDDIVSLIKGGVPGVDNKAKAGNWPGAPVYDAYGSQTDLWGDAWTPENINSSNFGVRLRVKTDALHSAMDKADVDAIKASVYYSN